MFAINVSAVSDYAAADVAADHCVDLSIRIVQCELMIT